MSLDENNIEIWRAQFIAARDSGAIVFWSGGTWVVSGVTQTYSGFWHVSDAGDLDGDGIPENIDPFPGDAMNNSFYWAGGAFMRYNPSVGNIFHLFRTGWYEGAGTDANSDGLPDVFDDWFTNPGGHGALQMFPGGTFLIEGAYSTFEAFSYYAPMWADMDGDLLPDEIDPFPNDAWNSTYYDWAGGDFYIDGVLTHFSATSYSGSLTDEDSDGIPSAADPYPLEQTNNSAFWQGGQFTINFVTQNLPARWHRADAVDGDADSIPDDFDPYLNDVGNPTLQPGQFYWLGGTFRIDGQEVTFPGSIYTGSEADLDVDSLPDLVDVWPQDSANNSAWWPGGSFTISGQSVTLDGQWHRADSGDQDNDSIPDDLDPYPADPNNGTVVPEYWAGGTFIIDGQSVFFGGQYYTGDFNDLDGDGLPNFADTYPEDATNNSFDWGGGEFVLNDIFVRFGSGWYAGNGADYNANGVPDSLDDWFADPSPHGQLQTWSGGTFTCDGQPRIWSVLKYYAAGWNDADLDSIPDEIDPYPADQNNNSGFTWPAEAVTLLYGNVQASFTPTLYGGTFLDSDGDTIPDQAETNVFVNDEWNGNDSDIDGIPDHVEVQYPGLLDRTDPSDATNIRPEDGIAYLRLHLYNIEAAALSQPLPAVGLDQPFPARDSDTDSMPEAYELRYGLNPFSRMDAAESPAGDLVFNFEKAAQAADPATPVASEDYFIFTGQSHAEALSHHNGAQSTAENDWDGDLVSNIDELYVFNSNARDAVSRPTDEQLIWAITGTHLLSATTGINFLYLVTPCDCSNSYCPKGFACNSLVRGSGCVCTYAPPACACSNNLTCPRTSTCVCSGDCFPLPPPCLCGGSSCVSPSTCSCGGGAGSLLCNVIPCICSNAGCPGSGCGCNGSGTCGGGPPLFEFTTSPTLPSILLGSSYTYQIGVQGGDMSVPVTFSLVAPSAPPSGTSFSAGGLLSGTPDIEGTSSFTVRASRGSELITRTFSLLVAAVPIVLEIPDSSAVSPAMLKVSSNPFSSSFPVPTHRRWPSPPAPCQRGSH